MNRRAVLAGTVSILPFLAGCIGGPPSGSSGSSDDSIRGKSTTLSRPSSPRTAETSTTDAAEPSPREDPEGTSTRTTERCIQGFSIEMRPFDATEHATVSLDDDARAIVAEAVENGEAKVVSYGGIPFGGLVTYDKGANSSVFVVYDGAFYEIDHAVETTAVSGYRINVTWERGQEAPADANVVAFADLSEYDRMALRLAACDNGREPNSGPRAAGHPCLPTESLSVGDFSVPYPGGGDASRLVGNGVTWVSWDGHILRVELGASTTAERRTHSYTAEKVAGSVVEFREVIASRFLVRLTDLPRNERAIVERAVRNGYEGCGTIVDTVPVLHDRLPVTKRLPGPPSDGWYARFDGEDYLLTLFQWTA